MKIDLSKIDVAILCGGLGTRLRSAIGQKQKTMAEINGQPFLDTLLHYLAGQGFSHAVLCAGYQAEELQKHYAQGKFGFKIDVSVESEPLGTGGAVKNAKSFIKSDLFLVLNGDCFCELDYAQFIGGHLARQAQMSLVVLRSSDKKDYGSISVDKTGRIVGYAEKVNDTNAGYISAGIYCLPQAAMDWMPDKKVFMFERDFFPKLLDKKIFAYEAKGQFVDIGTPERFYLAQEILRKVKG